MVAARQAAEVAMRRRDVLATSVIAGGVGALGGVADAALAKEGSDTRNDVRARDGTRLFIREWGSGSPMLFVHSWALESAMWNHQFVELGAKGIRCIAYDRRGHGRSDAPSRGYDMDTLADDLSSVIKGLGLRDVVLVGHSMGGGEILRYLSRHGSGRVGKVILLAPTTPFLTKTADNPYGAPAAYFAARRAEWAADFPKWVEDNKRPFFTAETSPATMDWLARMMEAAYLPAVLACNEAFAGTDLRPDLRAVDQPTLVIHGDKDASAPIEITGKRTADGIARATFKVYEGAPHGLFITHAKQLNADILAFSTS